MNTKLQSEYVTFSYALLIATILITSGAMFLLSWSILGGLGGLMMAEGIIMLIVGACTLFFASVKGNKRGFDESERFWSTWSMTNRIFHTLFWLLTTSSLLAGVVILGNTAFGARETLLGAAAVVVAIHILHPMTYEFLPALNPNSTRKPQFRIHRPVLGLGSIFLLVGTYTWLLEGKIYAGGFSLLFAGVALYIVALILFYSTYAFADEEVTQYKEKWLTMPYRVAWGLTIGAGSFLFILGMSTVDLQHILIAAAGGLLVGIACSFGWPLKKNKAEEKPKEVKSNPGPSAEGVGGAGA